jgi:hypothetical protein
MGREVQDQVLAAVLSTSFAYYAERWSQYYKVGIIDLIKLHINILCIGLLCDGHKSIILLVAISCD